MPAEIPRSSKRRIVLSGAIGNLMEWYDFAVYGYLASIIGSQFFPSDSPTTSILAAFGAFAAGFLARPLGGIVFGQIGDLIGRRHAMIVSVFAMAASTVAMGLLPTYETIGILAPVMIVALRIVQGISVGGEFTTSIIFLVENAPPGRRAMTAIWGYTGGCAGILLGSAIGAICASFMSETQLAEYGWRIPFLCGGLVAIIGYLIRRGLHAKDVSGPNKQPLHDTFSRHRTTVLRMMLLGIGLAVSFYIAFVYAVTYIRQIDRLPESIALDLNTGAMAFLLILYPSAAWLSDRYGRKPVLISGYAILTFGSIPLFHLMHSHDPVMIALGDAGFVIGIGLINGGIAATMVELMPHSVRCTSIGLAYNAPMAVFGGTAPLVAARLITETGDPIAPAYWVTATCAISLFAAIFLIPETRERPLFD